MKRLTWFDMAVNTHYLSEHVTVFDLSMHSATSFLPSNWDSSHSGTSFQRQRHFHRDRCEASQVFVSDKMNYTLTRKQP